MKLLSIIMGIILSLFLFSICLADNANEDKDLKPSDKALTGITFRDKNAKNVSFTLSPTRAYISITF